MDGHDEAYHGGKMFRFDGRWQEVAPIVFTNLLLTIVTLGIYRFWATTRVRHYLWSRTRLMDEPLEWTGTGKELLIGFLLVAALIGLPVVILQFGLQALALRGHVVLAGVLSLLLPVMIFYLVGVARFRALRYRLSRTYWRGIRGGSDNPGFGYGLSWMWKTVIGYLPLMLLVPWSMVSLWNQRWSAMSFGSDRFHAAAESGPVFRRFLLFYIVPFLIVVVAIGVAVMGAGVLRGVEVENTTRSAIFAMVLTTFLVGIGVYLLLGLVAVAFFAAFYREVIGGLSLGGVQFRFDASTRQWLMLILGDVLIVLATLGIGLLFLSYRHWKFFITHLDGVGGLDPAALGQSTTREPGQGEGLLDAFDLGAI